MGYLHLTYTDYLNNLEYWNGERNVVPPLYADVLDHLGYRSVSAIDFYDDLFGDYLEPTRERDDYRTGEYAAIALELGKRNEHGKLKPWARRYTITNDRSRLYDLIERSEDFCLMSAASYVGKSRKEDAARDLFAIVVEVDGIRGSEGVRQLMSLAFRPTYVVCSGTGLHLYFLFERPIPLWRKVKERMSEIKQWMTKQFWNRITSSEPIQFESVLQGFRIVGTRAKQEHVYTMAFATGPKYSIEHLNAHLPSSINLVASYKSDLPLSEAKKLYPDWYRRRIEDGEEAGTYYRHPGIYYAWVKRVKEEAVMGHRYWALESIASLAVQCQISPEQVESDLRDVAREFERKAQGATSEEIRRHGHITEYDVLCALETYDEGDRRAFMRKIDVISAKTGIHLERAKRNGRTTEQHVKLMNFVRDEINGNKHWQGRPSKEAEVKAWREAHPDGTMYRCAKETGMDKKTVRKWWN